LDENHAYTLKNWGKINLAEIQLKLLQYHILIKAHNLQLYKFMYICNNLFLRSNYRNSEPIDQNHMDEKLQCETSGNETLLGIQLRSSNR